MCFASGFLGIPLHFWDDDRFGCISSQDDQGLSHLLRGSRHLCPPQFPEAQHSCYATCAAMPVLHLVDLTFRFQKLNWRAWALQRWKMKQVGTCWSDNASSKIFWNGKRFLDPRERLMRKVRSWMSKGTRIQSAGSLSILWQTADCNTPMSTVTLQCDNQVYQRQTLTHFWPFAWSHTMPALPVELWHGWPMANELSPSDQMWMASIAIATHICLIH